MRKPYPRLMALNRRQHSLSPDDMKVPMRGNAFGSGGPNVAPNDNAGRPDPSFKKKRPQFTQKYYKKSTPHQDYLFGDPFGVTTQNPDSSNGRMSPI